jgi:hypothetical protein
MTGANGQPPKSDKAPPIRPCHVQSETFNRILTSQFVDFFLATRGRKEVELSADTAVTYAEQLAKEIATEHGLVTTRMTWNLTFQGFLFAAFALAASKPGAKPNEPMSEHVSALMSTLPWAGICTAALTLIGILAAFSQINHLKRAWYGHEGALRAVAPRPFSHWFGGLAGRIPSVGITGVLIGCWISLI